MQERQKSALVTGCSSGMGLVTAKALAAKGWHVIAHGRDPSRSETAEAAIRAAAAPEARVDFVRADLSSMADTARMAAEVTKTTDALDVLINNAGGVARERRITAEGNEATFAGNHLGHFLLTQRLLPLIRAAARERAPGATRVVNVASSAHEAAAGLDWDDVQSMHDFDPNVAYCRAKLANVLFTRELAKHLAGTGIVTHAVHPGAVDTRFFSHGNAFMQDYGRNNSLISEEDGADTIIWLATDTDAGSTSGEYWHERRIVPMSAFARDEEAAARLWRESEALVAASLQSAA